jgi:hypothetical protein
MTNYNNKLFFVAVSVTKMYKISAYFYKIRNNKHKKSVASFSEQEARDASFSEREASTPMRKRVLKQVITWQKRAKIINKATEEKPPHTPLQPHIHRPRHTPTQKKHLLPPPQ